MLFRSPRIRKPAEIFDPGLPENTLFENSDGGRSHDVFVYGQGHTERGYKNDFGIVIQRSNKPVFAGLCVQQIFGVDFIDKALGHGGHRVPPDREDKDQAICGFYVRLIVRYLVSDGITTTPVSKVFCSHDRVETIGM